MVVSAISHGDPISTDNHTDSVQLVVDADGAKVGAFVHFLRAN